MGEAIIRIPRSLYEEIKKQVEKSSEFKNVEEYVIFMLRKLLKEKKEEAAYSPEEEEEIKRRLKVLGYL